jgi:anti-sigma factor RsiW
VSCTDLRVLLHAYLDDELPEPRRAACAEHLLVCSGCRAELEALRGLRDALGDPSLRHRPSPALRHRLEAALAAAPGPAPRRRRFVWLAAAAAAVLAGLGVAWAVARRPPTADERLAREVTSAHARSLQAAHLLDRLSSDKHEVKPWFQERLDFAPPVPDLEKQGFRLEGGRLDYIDERPVAALVYRRHLHIVNVFVWPAPDGAGDGEVRVLSRRGYNLAHWTRRGLRFWAVSDLNAEELGDLARLVRDAPP